MDLEKLATEQCNSRTTNLDQMSALEIVTAMNQEDQKVPQAIESILPQIAQAVERIVQSFKSGGRLFYLGAGTSGRLGVLDAAECVPTFGTDPEMVQGLIAGGIKAMTIAVEGAEDNAQLAREDLFARHLNENDTVVGIAASGRTPYVIGGLDYAKELNAGTIALSCNYDAEISRHAEIALEVVCGPEVLSGSTRLKAGTSQKLVLNMLSTASMVGIGKTYGNLMVDVLPTNEKLVERATKMIISVTGVDYQTAAAALKSAGASVKVAIVMILSSVDAKEARLKLAAAGGFVREAIGQ
ncbi:N-acetylmuramic acid 6-phosphate etherase [Xylocopilactobacillus apicola]|uniref:N-acetylmuramic acid 6-phosphate etherase n=1 Tax=Xylocopilactobacillus apicola TaxID=2932184 RepID=A0AAU9CZ13_9LACO|nr:N-acetylmuramic acid 6-phosphate etherase [Xylocopilactobacillus apicola]BDR59257.1 N-acetylmuramic acid 6-phosphate etherase 2 [Xylocopilactobacillus apicola]